MPKATWKNVTIAASERFETVEGNIYFPPDTVNQTHLQPSQTTTICPWKGTAHYYDVVVNDETNKDAAWYYPEPKTEAAKIKGHIAFWRGVTIEK